MCKEVAVRCASLLVSSTFRGDSLDKFGPILRYDCGLPFGKLEQITAEIDAVRPAELDSGVRTD